MANEVHPNSKKRGTVRRFLCMHGRCKHDQRKGTKAPERDSDDQPSKKEGTIDAQVPHQPFSSDKVFGEPVKKVQDHSAKNQKTGKSENQKLTSSANVSSNSDDICQIKFSVPENDGKSAESHKPRNSFEKKGGYQIDHGTIPSENNFTATPKIALTKDFLQPGLMPENAVQMNRGEINGSPRITLTPSVDDGDMDGQPKHLVPKAKWLVNKKSFAVSPNLVEIREKIRHVLR